MYYVYSGSPKVSLCCFSHGVVRFPIAGGGGVCGFVLKCTHQMLSLSYMFIYLQVWESDLIRSDNHSMGTCLGYADCYQTYQHQVWYRDIPSLKK